MVLHGRHRHLDHLRHVLHPRCRQPHLQRTESWQVEFISQKSRTFTFLFQQAGEEGLPEHEEPDTPRRLLEENSRRGVGHEAR